MPEDDLILSEDEDMEDSQLTTPTAERLNINKLVHNYSLKCIAERSLFRNSVRYFFADSYNLSVMRCVVLCLVASLTPMPFTFTSKVL